MKRFLIRIAALFSGGIFLIAACLIYLAYITQDDLVFLMRAVSHAPQTTRFEYRDAENKIFDAETAAVNYRSLAFHQIDSVLNEDLIAIEDKNFMTHSGIDYLRTLKATFGFAKTTLLPTNRKGSGGSTLTQQLVKNLLGHHERSIWHKIREIFLAHRLESQLSASIRGESAHLTKLHVKQIILESYWNHLFVTQRHRGLGNLKELLLHSPVAHKLTAEERIITLALVRAPAQVAASEKVAQQLFSQLEKRFVETGRLSRGEAVISQAFARDIARRYSEIRKAIPEPDIKRQLQTSYARSVKNLFALDETDRRHAAFNLIVQTPRLTRLDGAMQIILTKKLAHLNRVAKQNCGITGAYMLIRLSDAAVVAASEDTCSEFNELIQSRRQVSSTIKPFLYTFALSSLGVQPSSIFIDKRVTVTGLSGKPYSPGNHYKTFRGAMNLKTALQISANTVSLQLFKKIRAGDFIDLLANAYARYPGENISARLHADYSLALGTVDLSPSHVTTAYLTLLSNGRKRYPAWGSIASTDNPQQILRALPARTNDLQIFDAGAAEQVREMLTAVLRPEGTGGEHLPQNGAFVIQELGAKSGSGLLDTWFVGFSQDLLLMVWLGFRSYTGLERDFHAATLWYDLFIPTLHYFPPRPMEYAPGLERRYFCAETGLPADQHCRRIQSALFKR